MGINNRCDWFIGVLSELGNGDGSGSWEPAAINNNNAIFPFNKTVIRVANKLSGKNPIAQFTKQRFLFDLQR